MKSTPISKRRFVFCHLQQQEIPVDNNDKGCCEFYNNSRGRCDYSKYTHSSHRRLSERDEIYREFSQNEEIEE